MDSFQYLRALEGLTARQVPRASDSTVDGLILGGLLQSGASSHTPGSQPQVRPATNDPDTLGQLAGQLGVPLGGITNLLPTQTNTPPPPAPPTDTPTDTSATPSGSASSTPSQTSDSATPTSDTASASSTPSASTPPSSSAPSSTPSSTPASTDATSSTPAPSSTPPPASSDASSTSTASSTSASDPAASAIGAASGPKSFIENKALSIPVITLSSLALLILIIVLATWAIRRRRRHDSVEKIVEGISTEDLVGPADVEKGSGRAFVTGHGAGSGSKALPPMPPPSGSGRPGAPGDGVFPNRPPPSAPAVRPGREMYERSGLPVVSPSTPAHGPATTYGYPGYYHDAQPGYGRSPPGAHPVSPYPPATHHTPTPHGLGNYTSPALRNPFDDPNGVYRPTPNNFLPPVDPVSPLSSGLVRKDSKGYRKAPPALEVMVRAEPSPPSAASSHSASSHDGHPMQLPSAVNSANPVPLPPLPPIPVPSPVNPALIALPTTPVQAAFEAGSSGSGRRASRHNSLLNGPPVSPSSEGHSSSESSHARSLDPAMPQLPVAAPLPDEFGSHAQVRSPSPEEKGKKKAVRQLKVVNQ